MVEVAATIHGVHGGGSVVRWVVGSKCMCLGIKGW